MCAPMGDPALAERGGGANWGEGARKVVTFASKTLTHR